MRAAISEVEDAMKTLQLGSPWDSKTKVSDDFLGPLFDAYFKRIDLPNEMNKKSFHELARYVPESEIDSEIIEKLDAIARVAEEANPACDGA